MASTTSKTDEPLTFHPDFTEPATAQIFQADDGTCFRFPFETLSVFSSFFRDLKSLPQTDGEDIAIPLPSATAQGLAYSFAAITTVVRGTRPPPLPTPDKDSKAYDDVINVADAYDLPVVLRALFRTAKATDPLPSPFTLYTLAALSKSSDEVKELSMELLGSPMLSMDKWNESTLRAKDPLALIDLHNFHWRFNEALQRFSAMGILTVPKFQFSATCKSSTTIYSAAHKNYITTPSCLVCRSCVSDSDTVALVKKHLVAAREMMAASPKLVLVTDFHRPATGCSACDKQLVTCIDAAKQRHILPTDYTLAI